MRLHDCIGCARPVIELRGQFSLLNSYYVNDGVPPIESSGEWHSKCLHESPYGEAWFEARKANYLSVRGYEVTADLGAWVVVRSPRTRETIALSSAGDSISLVFGRNRPQLEAAGAVYKVKEEYNLELSDRAAMAAIQSALTSEGTYPLLSVVSLLGIEDRMVHIEALSDGVLRFDRALKRDWSSFAVSVQVEYGVFVPAELTAYVQVK